MGSQKACLRILAKDIAQISMVLEANNSVEDAMRLGRRDPYKRHLLKTSLAVYFT